MRKKHVDRIDVHVINKLMCAGERIAHVLVQRRGEAVLVHDPAGGEGGRRRRRRLLLRLVPGRERQRPLDADEEAPAAARPGQDHRLLLPRRLPPPARGRPSAADTSRPDREEVPVPLACICSWWSKKNCNFNCQ